MRASMAYFAGAGTVIAAIGLGLGGGLTIANVMSPHQEKLEQTKLEQRMAAKPIPPSAQADQPRMQAGTANGQAQAISRRRRCLMWRRRTQRSPPMRRRQPQTQDRRRRRRLQRRKRSARQPAKPRSQTISRQSRPNRKPQRRRRRQREQAMPRSPEDANAKARDSDLKRLAAEKRKAERRQQWADRKKAAAATRCRIARCRRQRAAR